MKMLLQIIRLLTIACYFLPFTFLFVTCSGNNNKTPFDFAYNKKEAAENAIKDKDNCFGCSGGESGSATDTVLAAVTTIDSPVAVKNISSSNGGSAKTLVKDTSVNNTWTEKKDELRSSSDGVEWMIIRPTENSESAIGVLFFYKTLFGKIIIGLSFLISMMIFVIGCFKKHNKRLVFVFAVINLLCIGAFLIDALVNNVLLLYGAWLCIVLLLIPVVLQKILVKKISMS